MFERLEREEERSPKQQALNGRSGRLLADHANPMTSGFLMYTDRQVTHFFRLSQRRFVAGSN